MRGEVLEDQEQLGVEWLEKGAGMEELGGSPGRKPAKWLSTGTSH